MNNEDIIREIKEKINKNLDYINPCSKEFQNYIKMFGIYLLDTTKWNIEIFKI